MDDETLEKLAVQELLKEAKRGRERSATMGPRGWQKELVPSANKQFLRRTLSSVLYSHKNKSSSLKRKKDHSTDCPGPSSKSKQPKQCKEKHQESKNSGAHISSQKRVKELEKKKLSGENRAKAETQKSPKFGRKLSSDER